MTNFTLIMLIVQTIVFAIWLFLAIKATLGVTRRTREDAAKTGTGYPNWAGHSLRNHLAFLFGPGPNPERRRLVIWTLILFATIIIAANFGPGAA